ncbi:hypothetical protein BKI52_34975 [marine bacterium AO1-C]|nr:hypothetical protein BKI52_34975 [marine bacterium AO1-C]
MKKQYVLLLLVIIGLQACNKSPLVIRLSQEKLQKAMDKKFPYKKSALVAKIELTNPKLTIKDDKLFIDVLFNGYALTKSIKGEVNVSGKVAYKQEKKAFYMKDFHIHKVDIENIEGSKKDQIVGLLEKAVATYMASFPVYKLNKAKYKQNLARMLLQDVKTEGNQLVVTLGF